MKEEQFQLLDFKYDDKGLVMNYILDPGGMPRGSSVGWSKNEHNIPNNLIKVWRGASFWIAAMDGRIPAVLMEEQFGLNASLSDRNMIDKLTRKLHPNNLNFDYLSCSDYDEATKMFNPISLKLDEQGLGVQIGYEFKYMAYKATEKRKTPMVCIDYDEAKKAASLKDKFKFALFPWLENLEQWVEAFVHECYLVAKKDAEAKAAYVKAAKQLTINDMKMGEATTDTDKQIEQELQQQMSLN